MLLALPSKIFAKEKEASHRRRVILKNSGMSLLHSWLQRQVQVTQISRATKLSLRKCGYKIDIDSSQSASYRLKKCTS